MRRIDDKWDRSVVEWLPLVELVARSMKRSLSPAADYDDLFQWGCFGLAGAIRRFDPSRMTRFKTFASRRIRGAILDGIRSMDWVPRLERSRGDVAPQMLSMGQTLDLEYGDLAFDVNVEYPDPRSSEGLDSVDNGESVESLLSRICDPFRTVLRRSILEGAMLSEVAREIGVTEGRACQMRREGIERIRASLRGAEYKPPRRRRNPPNGLQFQCEQRPGRLFSASDAMAEAGVASTYFYRCLRLGSACRGLTFSRVMQPTLVAA